MASNGFGLLQWIGLGKKFIVEELPDYVTEFQSNLLEIPAVLFPPDTIPVEKLLEFVFPHKITGSELISMRVEDCFSTDDPRTDTTSLATQPIPQQGDY